MRAADRLKAGNPGLVKEDLELTTGCRRQGNWAGKCVRASRNRPYA